MRNFSTAVKNLLKSNRISTFYLVEIDLPSGKIYDTSTSASVRVGVIDYNPNNGLLSVEPPKLSDTLDREPYKITYIDPQFIKLPEMEASWTGIDVRVLAGFFNTTDSPIDGYAPGMPILNTDNLIVAYKGKIDKPSYTIDPDSGSVIIQLECASPAAALGLVKGFYTSDQSMKSRYSTDTSFRDVHVGGEEAAIVWGKK